MNSTDVEDFIAGPNSLRYLMDLYFNGFVLTTLSLLGVISNSLNIVIFSCQCGKDSGSLPLLALSFSDFGQTALLGVNGVSLIVKEWFPNLDIDASAISVVVASWPRTMFVDISVMIHVFVSLERSLCVAFPFRFRKICGRSKTVFLLILFYLLGVACYAPVYANLGFVLKWDPSRNASRLSWGVGPWYFDAEFFVSVFNSVGLSTFGQLTVMTSTSILIVALKKSTAFQKISSAGTQPTEMNVNGTSTSGLLNATHKNKHLSKIVMLISLVFIACNAPTVVSVYSIIYIPGLNSMREYGNVSYLFYCVVFFCNGLHASVNSLIYYRMSSKYRQTFLQLFYKINGLLVK